MNVDHSGAPNVTGAKLPDGVDKRQLAASSLLDLFECPVTTSPRLAKIHYHGYSNGAQ